ncbi:MAG TPA: aminotransferase class III-fold pyridoxal phosphate-dependent enzyme, partial [Xanthomonadales bacterium]|nr:aminotransferase class III-fold pyridoxal phosphate-dependent enzyme [Xanthomonadales bacterium]
MTAGLWCTNLGHGRERVAAAIHESALTLDYAPSFGFGHPGAFKLAERLAALAPGELNHAFFTSSGSEAVDTAMKMALAYHAAKGLKGRRIFIGRERGYHGVNFGGTAAGGIASNTRVFGRWGDVHHLADVLDIDRNAFSRGIPPHGVEKADELEHLINFHGAENVAAVIAEPIQGAGGVIIPPAGYLARLAEICRKYGVLLIFDEVVCAFGRTGSFTAAQEFEVQPDIMVMAKGLTSGTMPMGAVMCSTEIYSSVVEDSPIGIEFSHGYTYSAHPTACAAALACLDIYEEEGLFTRTNQGIGQYFEDALHSLRDLPDVIDIRNYGLLGAVEFAATAAAVPTGVRIFTAAWDNGLMLR